MYGDFSRITYSRDKAYTGVWSQQGRVQLDADANEQTAIVLDWLRTLAVDFIGPFGGHVTRAGFRVELKGADLTFSPGHYYVYGLRCQIPEPAEQGAAGATYSSLVRGAGPLPAPPYLVELLVWERSVSAVLDPDLLEPALGPYPPDTTVRTQVAWVPVVSTTLPDGTQLADMTQNDLTPEHISGVIEEYNADGRARPLLAAHVQQDTVPGDASIVPATSGYLGVENQLYRVEVHAGGTAAASKPTFKWSRENGSVEFRIMDIDDAEKTATDPVAKVTVASLGRDGRTGLDVGDWVELIDDTWAPQGTLAPLLDVRAIDRADRIITLGGGLTTDLSLHPYLRRWDQAVDGPGSPGRDTDCRVIRQRRRGHLAQPRRRRSSPLLCQRGRLPARRLLADSGADGDRRPPVARRRPPVCRSSAGPHPLPGAPRAGQRQGERGGNADPFHPPGLAGAR